uniref:NADH-ubiquinone oxidoreductase chain 6 n=1 Tax=Polytomella parva TaxID=51329 RepID=Q8LYV7_9CHLO|nr:NADH dehydrogenase subunit 6 [Polytomella parva]AAL65277.1 NADH dehydrogenase subunit 6 [Polytomella parva]7AR9_J Chain J, ND6 [Polytomella sp. Pringsheim 198.80]7ARD_J Chain J, ND6 [Polytomella sp. Pringsheim 198.80]
MLLIYIMLSNIVVLALSVVLTSSPFMALMYSILLYLNVQTILWSLGYDFMALIYALVYVGALAVLFLFVVMMVRIQVSTLSTKTIQSVLSWLAIILIFSYGDVSFSFPCGAESLLNFGTQLYSSCSDLTLLNSLALTIALFGSLV